MSIIYNVALATVTAPPVTTQWSDELVGVPPVEAYDKACLGIWLAAQDSAVSKSSATWEEIKFTWISFLSATGRQPNTILAPNRKIVNLSDNTDEDRFRNDRLTRMAIQDALWKLFDNREALLERWPRDARLLMNRVVDADATTPMASLMSNFSLQRRYNSVWSSLICFLVYAHEENGSLARMGLNLSEDYEDDLFSISEAMVFARDQSFVKEAVGDLVMHMLTDTDAGRHTNPLLWWTTVLVKSALDDGPEDFISRGLFNLNILPMDLDIHQRLEGIFHFAKVFLLDYAFSRWEPDTKDELVKVEADLNSVDNTWIGVKSSVVPADREEQPLKQTSEWQSVMREVENTFRKYLISSKRTAMYQVLEALKQFVMDVD